MAEDKEAQMQLWQINREAALRAHALDSEWQKSMHDSAINFAIEAVKAICLISGGSVVVGLAFVGSIYSTQPFLAKALVTPIFLLAASAVAAVACAALSYVAQYCYATSSMSKVHKWEHPYVETKSTGKRYNTIGAGAHILAVLFALASFGFIIWGGWLGWTVLSA